MAHYRIHLFPILLLTCTDLNDASSHVDVYVDVHMCLQSAVSHLYKYALHNL